MKNISYLDMVQELLSESEFLKFKECYNNPIKKSVKILNHYGYNNKNNIYDTVKATLPQERDLCEPNFSYNGRKYNDVLYATRKENLSPSSLGSHYLHQAGLIYVQEMAASLSVQMLGVNPGDAVLDMCAAPGGKSIQVADQLTDGYLISNEIDSGRKKALESNLHRCGIYNVGVVQQDGCVIGDKLPETFDKVLVDAPCSGEGMQYKSDKKVWQWDENKSKKLSQLQIQLLISGLKALKVGGELVYSTCTTNVLENEDVISEVLKGYGNSVELLSVPLDEKSNGIQNRRGENLLSIDDSKKVARLRPHIHQTGGFFIAKFRKLSHIGNTYNNDNQGIKKPGGSQLADSDIRSRLGDWGIKQDDNISFSISNYTVNALPTKLLQQNFNQIIGNINLGLPIFKIVRDSKNNTNKLIPLNGISQLFGHIATKNILGIDDNQLKGLMEKKDLKDDRLKEFVDKYVLLRWNNMGVGLVSIQNGIGKNKCF